MKVKDVMMRTPASCDASTNLGAAVEILWNRNCGILPVADAQGKLAGVVTDRDLCIALGTRNRLPGQLTVGQVVSGEVFTCNAEDEIGDALNTMARKKVRRLPVINKDGQLEGILSMDDIVLHAETGTEGKARGLSSDTILHTLKQLYFPELPVVLRQKSASA
ncbi:MAG: CBS domain-containing protein [Candidatus Acidiferrales bacterium]